MGQNAQSPARELISLQVLRAVAAILVVLSHISHKLDQYYGSHEHLLAIFSFGNYGVDIFFVISGFIIAYIIPAGNYSLKQLRDFLVMRVLRVMPLYWAVTLIAALVWLINPELVNSSAPHLTRFWQSWILWPMEGRYLFHAGWTLGYVLYFYALFAITMLWTPLQKYLLPLFLAYSVFFGWLLSPPTDQPFLYMITRHHLIEFLAGFLFCRLAFTLVDRRPFIGAYFMISAVLLVLMSLAGGKSANNMYFWGIPAMLLVFGALMIESSVKWPRFIVAIGNSSYSLYLTHVLVLAGLAKVWYWIMPAVPWSNYSYALFAIIASIICGLLSYRWFEKPLTGYLKQKWLARHQTDRFQSRLDAIAAPSTLSQNQP